VLVDVARRRTADERAGIAVLLSEVEMRGPVRRARLAEAVALGDALAGGDADL
jgi:hypothetical protein